jgi:hypothetical protein
MPATPASVGKKNNAYRALRHAEVTCKHCRVVADLNLSIDLAHPHWKLYTEPETGLFWQRFRNNAQRGCASPRHQFSVPLEELNDLLIASLGEVHIPLTNGAEPLWNSKADHLIYVLA